MFSVSDKHTEFMLTELLFFIQHLYIFLFCDVLRYKHFKKINVNFPMPIQCHHHHLHRHYRLCKRSNKLIKCVVWIWFSLTDELVRVYTVEQNYRDDRERRYTGVPLGGGCSFHTLAPKTGKTRLLTTETEGLQLWDGWIKGWKISFKNLCFVFF